MKTTTTLPQQVRRADVHRGEIMPHLIILIKGVFVSLKFDVVHSKPNPTSIHIDSGTAGVQQTAKIHSFSNYTGWCPPAISWFINPINYSYIYHKP